VEEPPALLFGGVYGIAPLQWIEFEQNWIFQLPDSPRTEIREGRNVLPRLPESIKIAPISHQGSALSGQPGTTIFNIDNGGIVVILNQALLKRRRLNAAILGLHIFRDYFVIFCAQLPEEEFGRAGDKVLGDKRQSDPVGR